MKNILVIRDDKIGDFALNWPLFYLLKQKGIAGSITVLVDASVASLARVCPYIDDVFVLSDDRETLVDVLSSKKFDACICYSLNAACKAIPYDCRIPVRLGEANRKHNHYLNQEVSIPKSFDKPTWQDCFFYLRALDVNSVNSASIPYPIWQANERKEHWRAFFGVTDKPILMVHPGSGGSSKEYPIEYYAQAIQATFKNTALPFDTVISWSSDEFVGANHLCEALNSSGVPARVMPPLASLEDYARSLVAIDIMLACSTGPLHLASLHNAVTVGLYAYKRATRWQTLSEDTKRFALSAPSSIFRNQRRNLKRISPLEVSDVLTDALNGVKERERL